MRRPSQLKAKRVKRLSDAGITDMICGSRHRRPRSIRMQVASYWGEPYDHAYVAHRSDTRLRRSIRAVRKGEAVRLRHDGRYFWLAPA